MTFGKIRDCFSCSKNLWLLAESKGIQIPESFPKYIIRTELLMNPQDQLKEFLVDFFSPIDNIPEDTVRREQICMEARASLLIEANCTSEYFPAFMKSGVPGSNCWIYKFSQPWSCKCLHHFNNNYKLSWSFKEFEIGTPSIEPISKVLALSC